MSNPIKNPSPIKILEKDFEKIKYLSFAEKEIDGIMISQPENRYYLRDSRVSGLLIYHPAKTCSCGRLRPIKTFGNDPP
jgi:hypothetical protein